MGPRSHKRQRSLNHPVSDRNIELRGVTKAVFLSDEVILQRSQVNIECLGLIIRDTVGNRWPSTVDDQFRGFQMGFWVVIGPRHRHQVAGAP